MQRTGIVAYAITIGETRQPEPARMMRVETLGPFDQLEPARPVSGVHDQASHVGQGVAIHRIERDRPFGGLPEGRQIPAEVQRRGERVVGEVVRRPQIHGAAGSGQRTVEGMGTRVEAVSILVLVEHREQGPHVGVVGRLPRGVFERGAHVRMLVGAHPRIEAVAAKHRLVGRQPAGWHGREARPPCCAAARHGCRQPWTRCAGRDRPAMRRWHPPEMDDCRSPPRGVRPSSHRQAAPRFEPVSLPV